MGFMNWYWSKKGMFSMLYNVWGSFFFINCEQQCLSNIGSAIGFFFTLKFIVPKLDLESFAKMGEILN